MRIKSGIPTWIPTLLVAAFVYLAVLYTSRTGTMNDFFYQVVQLATITAVSALGLNLIYGFNGQFSLGHIGFYAIGAYTSALVTKDFLTKWSGSTYGGLSWMLAGAVGVIVTLFVANRINIGRVRDTLKASLNRMLKTYEAGLIVFVVSIGLVAVSIAAGALAAWLLHIVFFAALSAVLPLIPQALIQHVVFFIALLTGGAIAALVAYLVGLPLLRLGSDYFGIATLGFAVMVYTLLQNSDTVIATMKGARGMVGIPPWTTWTWVFAVLVVVIILLRNMVYSSQGRAIVSVREDEIAAKAMGIDITRSKAMAFTFGGFLAGVAGGLYAHLYGFLHPSSFNMIKGFDPLIIIVFGGLGSMTGTIIASFVMVWLLEILRLVKGFEEYRFVFLALSLLVIMLLRSEGLLGKTEWGWLRAPMPPMRDIPVPERLATASATVVEGEDAQHG